MRRALLIGWASYSDARLRGLRAPAQDIAGLEAVLRDPQIGQFDVDQLNDLPEYLVRRRIERFTSSADPDDLLLLYMSGHGLRDETGQLFFAATDTDIDQLFSTAIPAAFVSELIGRSLCRSIVVILDCCFSGSFPLGHIHKSADVIEIGGELGGRGRAVLASSRATEYSFEGGELVGEHPVASLFTQALVRGLQGGATDSDGDGWITIDDLYAYAFQEVRATTRNQTPNRSFDQMQGTLRIAKAPLRPVAQPEAELTLPTTAKSAAVVNSLRVSVPDFAGREDLLEQLTSASGVIAINAIGGMPGVGKTELALRAAHFLTEQYPDMQIYLDLQGFTPGRTPVEPGAALESLLRAIEVSADQIPPEVDQRAALWRNRLAGLRILLVLDNAANEAQVTPLLPGASRSLTLITSRHTMADLDGATLLAVDVLDEATAVALFRQIVALPAATGEDDIRRIVSTCGRLPLAIRLAAGRLRRRPQLGVSGLANELAEADSRLSALKGGDRGVKAAFEVSYAVLDLPVRLVFRRLGMHPGVQISTAAAAALAGIDVDTAEHALEELLGQSLVQETAVGRFVLHDLLREYARECCIAYDGQEDRLAAEDRLIELLATQSGAAADTLDDIAATAHARRGARQWLELERGTLAASAQLAQARANPLAVALAKTAGCQIMVLGYMEDAEIIFHSAETVATLVGDRPGAAAVQLGLGDVCRFTGRYADASSCYKSAEVLLRSLEDVAGQSKAFYGLGEIARVRGDYEAARHYHASGAELCAAAGVPRAEADALRGLGEVEHALGDADRALGHYRRSVELSIAGSYRHGQLYGLIGMAETEWDLGNDIASRGHYQEATKIADETGDRRGLSNVLYILAETARRQGDLETAANLYRQVLEVTTELGNRRGMAAALVGIGQAGLALGRLDGVRESLLEAVEISGGLSDLRGRARALETLGEMADEDRESARAFWRRAVADYESVGLATLADQLQARIAQTE